MQQAGGRNRRNNPARARRRSSHRGNGQADLQAGGQNSPQNSPQDSAWANNTEDLLRAVRDWTAFVLSLSAFIAACALLYLFGVELLAFLAGSICFLAGLGAMRLWYAPKLARLLSAVEYLYEASVLLKEFSPISCASPQQRGCQQGEEPGDDAGDKAENNRESDMGSDRENNPNEPPATPAAIAVLYRQPLPPQRPCYRIKILGEEEYFCYQGNGAGFTFKPEDAALIPDPEIALRIMIRLWHQQGRDLRFCLEELERDLEKNPAQAPASTPN